MKKRKAIKIVTTWIMILVSVVMVVPLVWMISASCKVEQDVFAYPIQWIPKRFNFINNYRTVIVENEFFRNYLNSFIITAGVVILVLVFGSMCAYAFAKIEFQGRTFLFMFMLSFMMIPPQLTLIPRFMIVNYMKLYDTLLALILMGSFSVSGVFMIRQFIVSIPDSICESAKVDGASHWTIFLRIVFPMCKPALATQGILSAVWTWNDYQGPLVFLGSKEKFTVQLAVQQFAQSDGLTPIYSLIMAGATIAVLPLIIIFIVFQSQVIDGIAVGAVKG